MTDRTQSPSIASGNGLYDLPCYELITSMADLAPRREYRPALDGLRALAIIAVILYHLSPGRLPGGFLGVDLFFVLSGYLITGTLLADQRRYGWIDLAAFWSRRARRLLPALLLVLVVVALAVRRWESATDWPARRSELLSTVFYFANWHMIITGNSYFDGAAALSPLRHMWSLAVEEQFYLLWPLAVVGLLRWRRSGTALAAVTGVAATASAVVMVAVYHPGDPTRAYAGTDARVQELLIGVLLLLLTRHLRGTRQVGGAHRGGAQRGGGRGRWVRAAGPAALAASMVLLLTVPDSGGFYYRGGATLVALVFAALIWSVERAPGSAVARMLSIPPARWTGKVSYGMYLWHLPVIRFLPDALPVRLPAPVAGLAAAAVTAGLAAGSYYLVERPVRYGRLRLLLDRPGQVAMATAGAVAACTALVVVSTTWTTGVRAQQIVAADRAVRVAEGSTSGQVGGVSQTLCPDTTSICRRAVAAPGGRTIAVFGDSVARSLDPGFYDLARKNGWGYVIAAHNGCGLTGLVNVDGSQPKPFMRTCAEQTPGRIQQVLDKYHPDLVISLSRWELIAHLDANGHTVAPQSAQWAQDVHDGLRTFAQAVVRSGSALAMLAVVPLAPAGASCPDNPDAAGCTAAPDPLTAATNRIYEQVRAEVGGGVTVVPTHDLVCPGDQCRMVIQGQLVRFDGQHFTEAGARRFVEQLAPRLP
jgi:peptidoglycan/LPS O-acetylase OafA/YrhL